MPGQTGGQGTIPSSYGPAIGQFAWTQFPRIDNFGRIDPEGKYWKPDSNILTPPGYPITSLFNGTVTNVQWTSWGQTVVTIKMDTPLNTLATHQFFEHMHDSTVSVGQHVNAGDLIGHANYTGEGANLGYGFYSGDVFGSGSAWDTLQQDLAPGGAGLLNPVAVLNSFKSSGGNTVPPGIVAAIQGQPGNAQSSDPLCNTPVIGGVLCWLRIAVVSWALHIAFFILGIILIIIGFIVLIHPNPETLVKGAMLA